MRDLEIRGAEEIFSGQNSTAHMETVGYDLYCKMLSEAVREVKGAEKTEDFGTVVDISMDAFIPDTYIPDEFQKLDFYKRVTGMKMIPITRLTDEMMDPLRRTSHFHAEPHTDCG